MRAIVLLVAFVLLGAGCMREPPIIQGVRAPPPELVGVTAHVNVSAPDGWAAVRFVAPIQAWERKGDQFLLQIRAQPIHDVISPNMTSIFEIKDGRLHLTTLLNSLDWTIGEVRHVPERREYLLFFAADDLATDVTIRFGTRAQQDAEEPPRGALLASGTGSNVSYFVDVRSPEGKVERRHAVDVQDTRDEIGPFPQATRTGSLVVKTDHRSVGPKMSHVASLVAGSLTGAVESSLSITSNGTTYRAADAPSPQETYSQTRFQASAISDAATIEAMVSSSTWDALPFIEFLTISIPWSPEAVGLALGEEVVRVGSPRRGALPASMSAIHPSAQVSFPEW